MLTKYLTDLHVKHLNLTQAAELVNIASRYNADVSIRYQEGRVHMGSLIGALAVATLPGEEFVLEVDGEEEEQAMKAMLRALEV